MTKKNEVKAKTDIKLNIPVKFKLIESKSEDDKGLIEAYVSIFEPKGKKTGLLRKANTSVVEVSSYT